MRVLIKTIVILLLLFNGVGAIYGSLNLIGDPSGSKLQMPLIYLQNSPFNDYLIPGFILFFVNGLFSFITLYTIIINHRNSSWFVISQGLLLSGWIIVQVILLWMFYAPLHGTMLGVGVVLFTCGLIMRKGGINERIARR